MENSMNCTRTFQPELRATSSSDEQDIHSDSTIHAPSPAKRRWKKQSAFGKLESLRPSKHRSLSKPDVMPEIVNNVTSPAKSPTKKITLLRYENCTYGQKLIQLNFPVSKTMKNALNPRSDSEASTPISSPKRNVPRSKTTPWQKTCVKLFSESEEATSQNLELHSSDTGSSFRSTLCPEEETGSRSPILLKWPKEHQTVASFRLTSTDGKSESAHEPQSHHSLNQIDDLIVRLRTRLSNNDIDSESTSSESGEHIETLTDVLALTDNRHVEEVVSQICDTREESQNPFEGNTGIDFTTSTQLPLASFALSEKDKHTRRLRCEPENGPKLDERDNEIVVDSESDFIDNSQPVITNNKRQYSGSLLQGLAATQQRVSDFPFTSSQLELISDDDDDQQIALRNKAPLSTVSRLQLSSLNNQDGVDVASNAQSVPALTDDQKMLSTFVKSNEENILVADCEYYTEYIKFLHSKQDSLVEDLTPDDVIQSLPVPIPNELSRISELDESNLSPDDLSAVGSSGTIGEQTTSNPLNDATSDRNGQCSSSESVATTCLAERETERVIISKDCFPVLEQVSGGSNKDITGTCQMVSCDVERNMELIFGSDRGSNEERLTTVSKMRTIACQTEPEFYEPILRRIKSECEEVTIVDLCSSSCESKAEERMGLQIPEESNETSPKHYVKPMKKVHVRTKKEKPDFGNKPSSIIERDCTESTSSTECENDSSINSELQLAPTADLFQKEKVGCVNEREKTSKNAVTIPVSRRETGKRNADKSVCRIKSKKLTPNKIGQLLLASAYSSDPETEKPQDIAATKRNTGRKTRKELSDSTSQAGTSKEKDDDCKKRTYENKKPSKFKKKEFETGRDSVVFDDDHSNEGSDTLSESEVLEFDSSLDFIHEFESSAEKVRRAIAERLSSKRCVGTATKRVVASTEATAQQTEATAHRTEALSHRTEATAHRTEAPSHRTEATAQRTKARPRSRDASIKPGRRHDDVTMRSSLITSSDSKMMDDADNSNTLSRPKKSSNSSTQSSPENSSGRLENDVNANVSQQPIIIRSRRPEFVNPREMQRKRLYSNAERSAMVRFIEEEDGYDSIMGRQMWQQMEAQEVCPGRTWQSLKEHFIKNVKKNIADYSTGDSLKKFQAKFRGSGTPSSTITQRKVKRGGMRFPYTDVEDCAIIQHLIAKRRYSHVGGTKMWIRMEYQNVLKGRSWQSIKERYRKHIVPKLHTFDIPKEMMRKLR